MEKFSHFNDPFTGINPFIPPRYCKITFWRIVRALFLLPIYILYKLYPPFIKYLIKIKVEGTKKPRKLVYCNCVSEFDRNIVRVVFKINNFNQNSLDTRVVFPEGARTNNLGVLSYSGNNADYAIGLKYNNECVCMPYVKNIFEKIKWLVRFLGTRNTVVVNCIEGDDVAKAAGLPRLSFKKCDYDKFVKEFCLMN